MHDGTSPNDLRTICLRSDHELQILTIPGQPICTAFGSKNGFVTSTASGLSIIPEPSIVDTCEELPKPLRRRDSELDDLSHFEHSTERERRKSMDRSNSLNPADFLYQAEEVLRNDICVTMRRRVKSGYGMIVSDPMFLH